MRRWPELSQNYDNPAGVYLTRIGGKRTRERFKKVEAWIQGCPLD